MDVEMTGGAPLLGGTTRSIPAGLPVFSPVDFFKDGDGNMVDSNAVNTNTVVLGRAGEGKTHLTMHLIMQWAYVKGWSYGWVAAIMPRAVSIPLSELPHCDSLTVAR
jgi:hypothetical protein